MKPEPDLQRLIREIAETGVDPFWVYEAVAIEQEEAAERERLRAAAAGAAAKVVKLVLKPTARPPR